MRARVLLDMDAKASFDAADVARWCDGSWLSQPMLPMTGCSIDTRTLSSGDLFIAIRGDHSDGHLYVSDAISKGARAVLVEHTDSLRGMNISALKVSDARKALLNLARGYRKTLSCRMVAITGSVGKTTVKELTADMLQHVGITSRTKGNWNNDLGMPLSLLSAPFDTKYGVYEVGMNHPGELDPLCDVLEPDIGVITCIGPVHIEHFSSELDIAKEKAAVFRSLKGRGIAIVNADDPYAELLSKEALGCQVVTVSRKAGAHYAYRRVDPAHGQFVIHEKETGEEILLSAALPGEYFVLDATISAAVARSLGVAWPVIRDAIEHYQPLTMRWNRHNWFGVHTVNDAYNANPVSVRSAIQAFMEEPVDGHRWLVLAGMLELGADEINIHREVGEFVSRFAGLRLLTVGQRGHWIAEGALQSGMNESCVIRCHDNEGAAAILYEKLVSGDTVLFKASRGEAVEQVLRKWIKLKEVSHEGTGKSQAGGSAGG